MRSAASHEVAKNLFKAKENLQNDASFSIPTRTYLKNNNNSVLKDTGNEPLSTTKCITTPLSKESDNTAYKWKTGNNNNIPTSRYNNPTHLPRPLHKERGPELNYSSRRTFNTRKDPPGYDFSAVPVQQDTHKNHKQYVQKQQSRSAPASINLDHRSYKSSSPRVCDAVSINRGAVSLNGNHGKRGASMFATYTNRDHKRRTKNMHNSANNQDSMGGTTLSSEKGSKCYSKGSVTSCTKSYSKRSHHSYHTYSPFYTHVWRRCT